MKLYELTQNYLNLMELLDNPEIPEDVVKNALAEVQGSIEEKGENIAKLIRIKVAEKEALKAEASKLTEKAKSAEAAEKNLKQYLDENLKAAGLKKVNAGIFTLAIQRNAPSADIVDQSSIPEKYFIVTKELSKKLVLDDLKLGIEVPGAAIKQTESIRIR